MKSIRTKSKSKKNNTKFGKVKFSTKESTNVITPDLSALRKPIDISVSRLSQVSKLLENGSDEVKAILAYECDIVYECRVCRSLFRSLVNFISHKRVYCKEKFNITLNKHVLSNNDEAYIKDTFIRLHIPEQITDEDNCNNDRILRSQVSKEHKKDLTTIIDMLQKKQKLHSNHISQEIALNNNSNVSSLDLNKDSKYKETEISEVSIVYQRDLATTKTAKLQNKINSNSAILGHNELLLENKDLGKDNNLSQPTINDEDNESSIETSPAKDLICSICNAKFSTKKTLTFHMKTLHTSHRMLYPCPYCTSTFVNTWSVYRHLFKVHKMTNEQVRKLRIEIQEKAFRKEITHTDDIEEDNIITKCVQSTDQQTPNETREWMNHLESDAELQRCGGCGKRFDRKAALFSHSQHCQRRIAACNAVTSKIKKSAKSSVGTVMNGNTMLTTVNSRQTPSEVTDVIETSIRVENVTTLTSADWDMIGNEQSNDSGNIDIVSLSSSTSTSQELCSRNMQRELSPYSNTSNSSDIVCTSDVVTVNYGNKKRKVVINNELKTLNDTIGTDTEKSSNNIDSTLKSSSTQLRNQVDQATVMENKIATIANLRKLQCLPCKRKFTSMTNLRRHMAIHIGWNRYRCKLCNFKCFVKYDCVAHCNKMHNAQNNRAFITDMIVEIPQGQYMCSQDIVIDVTEENADKNAEYAKKNAEESTEKNAEENVSESQEISCSDPLNHSKTTNNMEKTNIDNTVDDQKESCSSDTGHNVSNAINNENKNNSNVGKNNVNHNARTLDSDPDLKRMVMEVIFGTPDDSSSQQSESEKLNFTSNTNSNKKLDNNERKDDYLTKNCKDSNSISISQDDLKPQRPIRNRVKPVDKDFIYDLKEVAFRKETVTTKSSTCKSLNKKPFVRWQNGEEHSDIPVEQLSKDSRSLPNHNLPLVIKSAQGNVTDKLDIKAKASLKTTMKLSHMPHFTQQPEITIIEKK